MEPEISFLCTRFTKIAVEGKAKLNHVLQLLKNTINDKRVVGADNLSQIFTWVDAAYGVHPYLKSHTGGGMSFGYGILHCRSSKQKYNTKIYIKTKLVGLSNYLTYNIWICLFMEAKGY